MTERLFLLIIVLACLPAAFKNLMLLLTAIVHQFQN